MRRRTMYPKSVNYLLTALVVVAASAQTGFSPGFLDTLEAIAGRPKRLEVAHLPSHWLGAYVKPADAILISPFVVLYSARHTPDSVATRQTRNAPDWVLSHEFGHRFDKRRSYLPSRVWLRESYSTYALCEYANTDMGERWAEAFANAVDFLRYAGVERSRAAVLRSRAQREAFVPGTSDVVDYLLRTRIFRDHPLNRRLRP